jgi:hypothetical protein
MSFLGICLQEGTRRGLASEPTNVHYHGRARRRFSTMIYAPFNRSHKSHALVIQALAGIAV